MVSRLNIESQAEIRSVLMGDNARYPPPFTRVAASRPRVISPPVGAGLGAALGVIQVSARHPPGPDFMHARTYSPLEGIMPALAGEHLFEAAEKAGNLIIAAMKEHRSEETWLT